MITAGSLYRALLPQAVREPLWNARHAVWQRLPGLLPRAWRSAAADRRLRNDAAERQLRKGRPIASVCVGGLKLNIDLRDFGVGRPLFVDGRYEPHETILLRRLMKPGQVFIDVGANIGYYTTMAARQIGPTGRVLAIEPDPHNFDLLCRNIKMNRLGNVIPVNTALGDKPGAAQLFCSTNNFGDHRLYQNGHASDRLPTPVTVVRLDDLATQHGLGQVDFIKMDVQGYECQVIAGMQATLAGNRNIQVLTELWPFGLEQAGGDPGELFTALEDHGFRAYAVNENGLGRPQSRDDVMALCPPTSSALYEEFFLNLLFTRQGG